MSSGGREPPAESQAAYFRERARVGGRSTLISQAIRLGCKALSVVLLARLVTPAEHGLFAMAASVTLFLLLFRDLSLGPAAVQASTLDEGQQATLVRIHLGLGAILALATLALAPVARRFYHAPEVVPLLITMSPSFLLIGAGGFARSQLARELRFVEINFLETIAVVLGSLGMIAAALAGAGAYAFATFLLVSEGTMTALAWHALGRRPHGTFQLARVRPLLRTSLELTSYHIVTYVQQQLDIYAVGAVFGSRTVGLYSRSAQVLALPNQHIAAPFTQIALATLSRLGANSPQFRAEVRNTATMIAHFALPAAALCFALPEEMVRLVLGGQWPDAAPMLRWLAVTAAITACTALAYGINVATGQTRHLLHSALGSLPVMLVAIFLGLRHGPAGVALSLAIANLALLAPRLVWVLRGTPVPPREYLAALVGPLQVAVVFALGARAAAYWANEFPPVLRLGVGVAAGLIVSAGVVLISSRLRTEFGYVWRHLPWTQPA